MRFVALGVLLTACHQTASSNPVADSAAPVPSVARVEASAKGAAEATPLPSGSTDSGSEAVVRYAMVTNLEMTPYCLPVPESYVQPDRSERWERGRHVFVNRSKQSKIDYAGWCSDKSLKELYDVDRARTQKEGGGKLALNAFHSDNYVLSWSAGKRIHYGKVWARKADAGCFVRVTFDYDESERALFDGIISKVVHADPSCAP